MSADLVHAHVYDPMQRDLFHKPKKTEPAEYHTVSCSIPDTCPLRAQGKCIARQFMGGGCQFGRAQVTRGPTYRAKGFRDWMRARREEAAKIGTLNAPPLRAVQIQNAIWLPYPHMNAARSGETRLADRRSCWVSAEEFTPGFVAALCEARPRTIFNDGEIRAWQQESVPLFVAHLSESFPDLLSEAAAISPQIRAILPTLTKVGRTAKLATVVPNIGTFEDGWRWDGTHMIATDRKAFPPFTKFNATEVRIVPGPDATVKITDNAQCDANTTFVD